MTDIQRPTDGADLVSRRRLLRAAAVGAATLEAGSLLGISARPALAGSMPDTPSATMPVYAWLTPKDPASMASLRLNAGQIAYLSPTWYIMNGDLSISSIARRSLIEFARDHTIVLLPRVMNANFDAQVAAAILATPDSRARAAREIASLVLRYDYGGVNMDFEGRFAANRDGYSDLLARLAERLHLAGKRLTVDVSTQLKPLAAYSDQEPTASYDYTAIAQVCDAVMLMAYDRATHRPGSLAPLWWVQQTVAYALTQIPAQKLVLGIAFYGRHWIARGQQVTHTDIRQSEALALLASSGATLQRPPLDATPRFTWHDAQGQHTVHFEDGPSLAAKLQLAQANGLAGVAFWRLGQEAPSQWQVIAEA